jgi:hypothetical protein
MDGGVDAASDALRRRDIEADGDRRTCTMAIAIKCP